MILIAALEISALTELSRLSTWFLCAAVYSAPIIARLMMVVTIGSFPYARPEGMGKAFAKFTTRRTIIFAGETFLFLLPLSLVSEIFLICAASACLIALIVTRKFATFAMKKIGGVTGDIYGAVTTLAEMFVPVIFLLFATSLK